MRTAEREMDGDALRRLGTADAAAYHALRLEGFARHPMQFRYSPADEVALACDQVSARLASEFVVGAFAGGVLSGIGGYSRFAGEKLRHKALLWGMYVREEARGRGLADRIVRALLERGRDEVEVMQLTVVADNHRAIRLYQRWGFAAYATEPAAIKVDGIYRDELLMMKPLP